MIKTLLLPAFALCAFLAPINLAEAKAPKPPKPPTLFGGFAPGKTFTFTVTEKSSGMVQGGVATENVPVPKGIPNFTVGQQVTFTIGKKGELLAPGVKINYLADGVTSNAYLNTPKKGANPTSAIVFKNTGSGEPVGFSVSYFTFKIAKRTITTNEVTYLGE
jgi:hypothetical protein